MKEGLIQGSVSPSQKSLFGFQGEHFLGSHYVRKVMACEKPKIEKKKFIH